MQFVQPSAIEKSITFHVDCSPGLPGLEADRDKIKQVLINLLNNAIKYNQHTGSVVIQAYQRREMIFIDVQDTGLGIPESELPLVFEKFFRSQTIEHSTTGTGLGLSICKRIVENPRWKNRGSK